MNTSPVFNLVPQSKVRPALPVVVYTVGQCPLLPLALTTGLGTGVIRRVVGGKLHTLVTVRGGAVPLAHLSVVVLIVRETIL